MSNEQVIKMNPELMCLIESGQKTATTRVGFKEQYHLGAVKFQNNQVESDVLDKCYEITKIEAIDFYEIDNELAEKECFNNADDLRSELIEIYGPIDEFQTMTVIYWNR